MALRMAQVRIGYADGMGLDIKDSSTISRGEGWLSAWVGEEHVMMSADTGTCISLSETGGRIWELMEQPVRFADLCHSLADEYEVDPVAMQGDVATFLEAMRQQHAVTVQ